MPVLTERSGPWVGGSVIGGSAAPLSPLVSCSASTKSANHRWIVPARSFTIIASQRIRRSVKGIESAVAIVRAMPSMS